jgi:hypothetical protein
MKANDPGIFNTLSSEHVSILDADLSEFDCGMMTYLRKIAYGQVLPELVELFRGKLYLLQKASSLPLPEQHRLARREPIRYVSELPDGTLSSVMRDPLKLTFDDVRQVFGKDYIRSAEEQKAYLQSRRKPVFSESEAKSEIVQESGGVRIRGLYLTWKQMLEMATKGLVATRS